MPAVSRRQYRLMQAMSHGTARQKPKGLSRAEALEFVAGQSPKGLPERASKSRKRKAALKRRRK